MSERVLVSDDNQRAWLMESGLLFDNGRWYKYGEKVFGPSDVYENFSSASPSEAAEWLKKAGIPGSS